MSDYFTQFSFEFQCTEKEGQLLLQELKNSDDLCNEYEYNSDKKHFWIGNLDFGDIETTAKVVQQTCQETLALGPITFEWSHSCSKPVIDAFGGGYCIIKKDDIIIVSTDQLLEQHLQNIEITSMSKEEV